MAGAWTTGLLKSMKDPKFVVFEDLSTVIVKDMYPKATYHFLVICKEEIAKIKDVKSKHISLLEHMEQIAREYVNKTLPGIDFRFGYHAEPSMHRLHLHIISSDMISDCLKTKKHWNSFTSEFFIPSSDILSQLKSGSTISLPTSSECERLLKRDLKCHRCSTKFSNMPKLKEHLLSHN